MTPDPRHATPLTVIDREVALGIGVSRSESIEVRTVELKSPFA